MEVYQKETPAELYSFEFFELFHNSIFTEHLCTSASPLSFHQALMKGLSTLFQCPGWIHLAKFSGENEGCKITARWKVFQFFTSLIYIILFSSAWGKCWIIDIPRWNSEFHPDEFFYYPGDITQTVFGPQYSLVGPWKSKVTLYWKLLGVKFTWLLIWLW